MRDIPQKDYYVYSDLIDSMGFSEELVSESEVDYQGDTFMLVREGERFGLLIFGWGSCSGCDALQACYDNPGEVQALRDQLYNEIRWFSSLGEAKAFIAGGQGLSWYEHSDTYDRFRSLVADLPEEVTPEELLSTIRSIQNGRPS